MVGVPIDNDEYVLERARGIVKEGGTDHLASCLANKPDKQSAILIITESVGQRTGYLQRALDTQLPSKHAGGQTTGHNSGNTRKSSSYRAQRRHSRFSRKRARMID